LAEFLVDGSYGSAKLSWHMYVNLEPKLLYVTDFDGSALALAGEVATLV
jgi:hypothetical protein